MTPLAAYALLMTGFSIAMVGWGVYWRAQAEGRWEAEVERAFDVPNPDAPVPFVPVEKPRLQVVPAQVNSDDAWWDRLYGRGDS
jgi:hypothetical protein